MAKTKTTPKEVTITDNFPEPEPIDLLHECMRLYRELDARNHCMANVHTISHLQQAIDAQVNK